MRKPGLAALAALVVLPLLAVVASTAGAVPGPGPNQPVRTRSYPDPFVLPVDGTFWAYATDGDLGEVQLIKSTDLVSWTDVGDALGSVPSWAQDDDVWAPAVTRLSTTSYALYASFVKASNGRRCIGVGKASAPAGPFPIAATPIICDDARGGVIDPAVHDEGGTRYLLWKTEGVPGSNAEPPSVFSQQLSTDGTSLVGSPVRIFRSEQPWEGTLVENPSMVQSGGRHYLFYSGNEWESAAYGIGWAACEGPLGPCIAPPDRPLLASAPGIYGPGGGAVFADDQGLWMAFAAWTNPNQVTEATGQRSLFLRRLTFAGGRPLLAGVEPAFTERTAGPTRYETAAAFSAITVQAHRPIVYVATGATYHDALIGAAASGFEESPVLLVERDRIPDAVQAELRRLDPGHIVVMGGTDAISSTVEAQLRPFADGLHREAGVNVYHRAALVSRNTYDPGVGVVYVATGQAFPDALAGGAAAAANDAPLLFVQRDSIPVDPAAELDRLNPRRIVVLGGTAAISDGVVAALRQYSGDVTRVAGADRYATSAALAGQFRRVDGSVAAAVIATGQQFPDAVTAGAAGYPVLLVPSCGEPSPAVKGALNGLNPLAVVVMGGTAAVCDATLDKLGL